jgi:hypothetical protein
MTDKIDQSDNLLSDDNLNDSDNSTKNVSSDEKTPNKTASNNNASKSPEKIHSVDHLHDLREENKRRRLKEDEYKEQIANLEKETSATKKMLADERKRNDEIRKFGELKTEAVRAGINDIEDIYKLADLSKVTITERGEVLGAIDVVKDLQTKKPYLFRTSTASGLSDMVPNPATTTRQRGEEPKPEEYDARIAEVKAKFKGY